MNWYFAYLYAVGAFMAMAICGMKGWKSPLGVLLFIITWPILPLTVMLGCVIIGIETTLKKPSKTKEPSKAKEPLHDTWITSPGHPGRRNPGWLVWWDGSPEALMHAVVAKAVCPHGMTVEAIDKRLYRVIPKAAEAA